MPEVFHSNVNNEFYIQERCFVIEILNLEEASQSIARIRVLPGVTTALHRLLGVDESYYILKGQGGMEISGQYAGEVKPGDVVIIPAGQSQRIKNTGNEDLIFIATCSPRFTTDCYEHLEK